MWKLELVGKNYQVKREDGSYVSTFHPQFEIIPITWDKKYNSPEYIKEVVKDFWGGKFRYIIKIIKKIKNKVFNIIFFRKNLTHISFIL